MKRIIKKSFPLILAVVMAFGLAQSAMAETVTGTAVYDGSGVRLSYSAQDIKARLSSLTPGDDVTFEFTLSNTSGKAADWYVQDSVIRTFEDSTNASDGAYTYDLSYTSPAGKTTDLYSSEVGGITSDTTVPAGLHQAATGTDRYFYLDRIASGKTGTFKLSIAIDGETLRNDYQSTLADLQVNFAVEVPDEEDSTVTSNPKTGDDSGLTVYIVLFVAAAVLLAVIGVIALRMRKKGGSDE